LEKSVEFQTALSEFQDTVITLVEVTQNPIAGIPPTQGEQKPEEGEGTSKVDFTLTKGIVIAVMVLSASAASIISPQNAPILAITVLFGITLMFLPQVRDFIKSIIDLFKKKEVEETSNMRLEDWVTDSLSRMRRLYTSASFLIKVQNQTRNSLPNYGLQGMDDALFDRKKFFNETLPTDFLNWIGKIVIACDKNLWQRRSLIISAMVQAKQMAAKGS
jgi:hypothetical protein